MEQQKIITITMEEYKELLIIKGKYEELKSQQQPFYTGIKFNGNPVYKEPDTELYKVTCDKGISVCEGWRDIESIVTKEQFEDMK